MQPDAEFFLNVFRFGNLRAEDMDFVAAADHFLDQINRLRRTAAGRRIKRLVRQERDAQRRLSFTHTATLFHFRRRVQINSAGLAKNFDKRSA